MRYRHKVPKWKTEYLERSAKARAEVGMSDQDRHDQMMARMSDEERKQLVKNLGDLMRAKVAGEVPPVAGGPSGNHEDRKPSREEAEVAMAKEFGFL